VTIPLNVDTTHSGGDAQTPQGWAAPCAAEETQAQSIIFAASIDRPFSGKYDGCVVGFIVVFVIFVF
jgi:hypothetical protein